MGSRRAWWATWPGALALGALSLVMAGVTAVPLLVIALLPPADVSGTALPADESAGLGWRIAYVAFSLAFLAVPVAVVVVARKAWLGWLLVLLAASAVILGMALWFLGLV